MVSIYVDKIKNTKYHTIGKTPKSNIKTIERGKIDTRDTQIHDVTHKYMTAHFPDMVQAL